MKRPSRDLKANLLKAATRLVANHGYAGTSVQQVVSEARATKPALYYYFRSKAGLCQALVDHAYQERMRLMQQARDEDDSMEEQLVAICRALLDFAVEHRDLMRICFATAFAAPGELPAEIRMMKQRKLQKLLP